MAVVGEMHYLTIGNNTYSIPVSGGGGGTVTSVRVQATSPVQSSTSGEQTVSLNTTISLADEYGDTKNPYGTKAANYILAGPTSGSAAVPTFRALTATDIPDLSASYLPVSTVIPSKTSDLTNDSGFITGMTILSYGTSTWNDFITAYNANKVVYCRASSNSNPASGSQTRLAFMAYVNNAASPTEVEFQYYRSVSSHSDSQQGDQVFVYKITSAGTWTVTTRNTFTKIAVDGDLTGTYANGTLTISADIPTVPTNVSDFTNDAGYLTSEVNSSWVNGSQTGSVRTVGSVPEDSSYTIGQYAVAEGGSTRASGAYSHAEGAGTTASGYSAHAEGAGTTARGNYSHAEGTGTTASGFNSHAEGGGAQASGDYSHAEGAGTTASGSNSHAEGGSTIANHYAQHVFGEWNIADSSSNAATERGNYVEIVGNGTSSTRSNARTLDWSGNEVLAGKLTIGANPTAAMDVVTKQYMENQSYLTLATLPIYNGTVE